VKLVFIIFLQLGTFIPDSQPCYEIPTVPLTTQPSTVEVDLIDLLRAMNARMLEMRIRIYELQRQLDFSHNPVMKTNNSIQI